MPAASLDAMSAVAIDADRPWTGPTRTAFLELLRCGPRRSTRSRPSIASVCSNATCPRGGRSGAAPSEIRTTDPRSTCTCWRRSPAIARLLEDPGDDPSVALAVRAVPDADALRLGALLHDIGKTGQGHHVETGTQRRAREPLDHVGASGPTADLALFLVAEHLLLSDTATRRDLDDERLIVDVADRVGDQDRLGALYLLTIADAEATGPLAWTPWRAALVRELVAKVRHVLQRDDVGSGTAERLTARAEEIRAALADEDAEAVETIPACGCPAATS